MKYAISKKNLWEKSPPLLKATAGLLLRPLPMRYLIGRRYRAVSSWLERSQWWSHEQITAYQLAEVRRLCGVAGARSPYYRELFRAARFDPDRMRSLEELARLPFQDKQSLNANLERMLTSSPDAPGVDYVTTGGTSGEPLGFYIGADRSQIEFAYLVAGWERAGYRPGVAMAVLRGRVVEPDANGLRHGYDPLLRQHFYSNFHLNEANAVAYLRHIASIGDCVLHVYPSAVMNLARFVESAGVAVPPNIRAILAESEIVYPEQREFVERVFGVRYFSSYGHTEKLVAAAECEQSRDYHVWPTYGYLELIDEQGRRITEPGARGEIVGTGFINQVTPFIRYRTGDFATLVADRCEACGRNHRVLSDLRGHRTQEVLVARDGTEISWTAINMHDSTFDGVRQLQFLQREPGFATLRIVPKAGVRSDHAQLLRALEAKLGGQLAVKVEEVAEIPLSRTGKTIYVDQRIERRSGPETGGVSGR